MVKLRLGAIQQLCQWLRGYSGGISRVVDMTICLQNPIWNPTLCFLESGTFFWNRTLFLESKLEIENSFFRIQNGIRSVFGIRNRILKAIFGIQNEIRWNPKWNPAFFFKSKLESDSKFFESKWNPTVLLEIQNIIHGYF